MSIIDTFTILFKNNAKETEKDVSNLDKSITKAMDKINKADVLSENLAKNLLKVGLEGLAAFASFEAIKDGVIKAANFNAELEKMQQLTGANASEIAAWDAAFTQLGAKGFASWFTQTAQEVQRTGGEVKNILPFLKNVSKELKNIRDAQGDDAARSRFQQYAAKGLVPADFYNTLSQGPDEIDKVIGKMQDLQSVSDASAKAGFEFGQVWQQVAQEGTAAFTPFIQGGTFLLKILRDLLEIARIIFDTIALPINAFGGLLTGNWSNFKENGDDLAKVFNSIAKNTPAEISGLSDFAKRTPAGKILNGLSNGKVPIDIRNNNPGNLRSWGTNPTSGGFALFPNMQAGLSAEDKQLQLYGGRGINTLSKIISTWAPSSENNTAAYIAAASKMTGFGANQALDLSNPGVRQAVVAAINNQESGGVFAKMMAAGNAINQADNLPLGSLSAGGALQGTVNIGNITVNTQATDANGIAKEIHQSLNDHLTYLVANNNDGIAK